MHDSRLIRFHLLVFCSVCFIVVLHLFAGCVKSSIAVHVGLTSGLQTQVRACHAVPPADELAHWILEKAFEENPNSKQ